MTIGQHLRDALHKALMGQLDKFRRLEGEAMTNTLLRQLVSQSNAIMRDLGFTPQDDTADLQAQLMKARADAAHAMAYANHFSGELQKIVDGERYLRADAEKALKWQPGIGRDQIADGAGQEPERATH